MYTGFHHYSDSTENRNSLTVLPQSLKNILKHLYCFLIMYTMHNSFIAMIMHCGFKKIFRNSTGQKS